VIHAGTKQSERLSAGAAKAANLHIDSIEGQSRVWAKLSAGGTTRLALHETFWGARFGMFTDKFGIDWMLNCERAKK
jgi:PhnB protein